jgi:hypothetical protein
MKRPFVYFYCPVFLLYELSSPFLNIHWFCDKVDLTGSTIQAVNGAFLTGSFFCCRIVWGLYNSFHTFNDIFTAYRTLASHTAQPGMLGDDNWERQKRSGDLTIYSIANGQDRAFMGERYLPLWIPIVYLASNLVLNALNIWWFGKMIATIRSRFDPPFGTKGVGQPVKHWEPEEKIKTAKNKLLGTGGGGSVKAARERAEQVMGAAAADPDPDQKIEVERSVFADGHRGVEVTGTTRRSARSRRKA